MPDAQDRPIGADTPTPELMRQLADQMSTLVLKEMELAKAELSQKGKQAGIGAGLFGGAGVIGLYTVGALITTVIALLSRGMATWVAAGIVTVVLALIAGVLALQGKSKVAKATPPAPERAIASVKQDTDTIKTRAQDGRSAR